MICCPDRRRRGAPAPAAAGRDRAPARSAASVIAIASVQHNNVRRVSISMFSSIASISMSHN